MKSDARVVKERMRQTLLDIATIVRDDILELLFPTQCLGCSLRGTWFCDSCHAATRLQRGPNQCLLCNRLTGRPGTLCPADRRRAGLTGLATFGTFHALPLARAVHAVKYQAAWAALPHFAVAFLERNRIVLGQSWTALIPIPLAPRRLHERGFNQSFLFAQALAPYLNTPVLNGLVRTRETRSQVGLTRIERRQNVDGAFLWSAAPLTGAVLLIDDVFTTGATLGSACRALRRAGAKTVWGATLAIED